MRALNRCSLFLSSVLCGTAFFAWRTRAYAQAELCVIDTDCELNGTVCGTDICSWCATPGPGCTPAMTMTHNCVATNTGDPGWCDGASQPLADVTCKCHLSGAATCNLATHHCTSQKGGDGGAPPPGMPSGSSGSGGPRDGGGLGSGSSSTSSSGGGVIPGASGGSSSSTSSSSGAGSSSNSSSGVGNGAGSVGTSASSGGGSNAAPAPGGCAIGSDSSSRLGASALGLALLFRLAARRRSASSG